MNKQTYQEVASIINKQLRKYDNGDFKPRVSVVCFADDWNLFTNNEAASLLEDKGKPQDMFYADEVYVVGDDDLYIEPVLGSRYFGLAIL